MSTRKESQIHSKDLNQSYLALIIDSNNIENTSVKNKPHKTTAIKKFLNDFLEKIKLVQNQQI